jgi:predicted DNA-binding transcriptional regulator YafY
MIEACAHENIKVSRETISKDIKLMKKRRPEGLEAPIAFDFSKQEYYYEDDSFSISGVRLTQEESSVLQESLVLIKCLLKTELGDKLRHAMEKVLSTSIEEPGNILGFPVLKTMEPPRSRGYEFMDLLLHACRARIPISFVHYSYSKEAFNAVVLHPCLVREFDNRWYVFGYSEGHNSARCFGLDRMNEPVLLQRPFWNCERTAIDNFLNHMYGVYPLGEGKLETVTLRASPLVTKVLSANPIHDSQVVEKNRRGVGTLTFTLIPTMELIQFVRSHGRELRIIEPEWLANYDKLNALRYRR